MKIIILINIFLEFIFIINISIIIINTKISAMIFKVKNQKKQLGKL